MTAGVPLREEESVPLRVSTIRGGRDNVFFLQERGSQGDLGEGAEAGVTPTVPRMGSQDAGLARSTRERESRRYLKDFALP